MTVQSSGSLNWDNFETLPWSLKTKSHSDVSVAERHKIYYMGDDALPSPGLNPLQGPTMCSCGKLGLEGRSRLPTLERGRGVC